MTTTVNIFEQAFETMKAQFPTAVVLMTNGSDAFSVIRNNQTSDANIDPMTGRIDPDVFAVRALVSECGNLAIGRTVLIGESSCTIQRIEPDSIGVTVTITLKRRRIAGQ